MHEPDAAVVSQTAVPHGSMEPRSPTQTSQHSTRVRTRYRPEATRGARDGRRARAVGRMNPRVPARRTVDFLPPPSSELDRIVRKIFV
jgi:hypothetical protein